MFLKIENPDGIDLSAFCEYLIGEIVDYVDEGTDLDEDLAQNWTDYFKSTDLGWVKDELGNSIAPTFDFIMDQYFDALYFYETDGAYFITSDSNRLLNSTDLTIDSLATMINDGVIGMKAYAYIDQVFNYFAEKLQDYFNIYLLSVEEDDGGS